MRDDLILDNLNLIYFALKQLGLYEELDEYYDLGLIGLVRAADSFDPGKGFTFTTYAIRCIRNEILKELRLDNGPARKANKNTISLESVVLNDSDGREILLIDMIPSDFNMDEYLIRKETMETLQRAFNLLNEKEQYLLKRYYGSDKARQRELATELHTTQSAVSRKIKMILKRLGKIMKGADNGCNGKNNRSSNFTK